MVNREPLHNFSRSRAVVMGTADYAYLPPVPAAGNSLERMVRLLAGPLCGWPQGRIEVVADERRPGDLADRLITAFEDVSDVALFYYVGHGQIDIDDQLCLGLAESRIEANRRAATSLLFQTVRRALLESPANTKIIILDCCFAGLAINPSNTLGDPTSRLLNNASVPGAFTITASGPYTAAWYEAEPGIERPQTYFTRYLADLVEAGMPGDGLILKLNKLFLQLRDNLDGDRRPVPQSRSINDASNFAFAYNAAWAENRRDRAKLERRALDARLYQMDQRLTEVESHEAIVRTKLDERARELQQLTEQMKLAPQIVAGHQEPGSPITNNHDTRGNRPGNAEARLKQLYFLLRNHRVLACSTFAGIAACLAVALFLSAGNGIASKARLPGVSDPPPRNFVNSRIVNWKYKTAGLINSSPLAAGRTIYVGSDGGLYALNAYNGTLRWADASFGTVESSPTLAHGTVYIGSFDDHQIYALNAETGRIRWTYHTGGPVESSPFVAGGTVYIGSFDGKIYAIDAETGRLRWSWATRGAIISNPFVADGTVYIGSFDSKVYALSADTGHLRWSQETQGPVESSPVVHDGIVYVGSDDHRIYALKAATGRQLWSWITGGEVKSSPSISNNTVYIGSDDGKVYALEAVTGRLRWARVTGGPVESSPVVHDGIVYVGSDDHRIYALGSAAGHLSWSHLTAGAVVSSPCVVGGVVYVGSFDDNIYALNATTGA